MNWLFFIWSAVEPGIVTKPPVWEEPPGVVDVSHQPQLNLNRASAMELALLPGSDAFLGRSLVVLRIKLGGFKQLNQLLQAEGMSPTLLKSWRPLVRL